jgi:hypothetical protein
MEAPLLYSENIDRDIAELRDAIDPLFDNIMEREIALLVHAEFSIEARIARATKAHRPRRHLRHAQRLAKTADLAA